MRAVGDWEAINPGESDVRGFDFVKDLRPGDSILDNTKVSFALTVAPNGGTDPTPQSHVTGPPTLTGTIALQRFAGTLPFVLYIATATVITVLGDTLILWTYLPSYPPGAQIPTPI